MALLTGNTLHIAWNRTEKPVDLRDENGKRIRALDHDAVLEYLARGYEAHGDKRHFRYLRPPVPVAARRPELPFAHCYLNSEAPVIRFWADQVTPGVGSQLDSFV